MSDNVEIVAAAQVSVSGGVASFNSNYGFDNASYVGVGGYVLNLTHKHDAKKLVIQVTRNAGTAGEITASPVSPTGDVRDITVNAFGGTGVAADASFFITVLRVRD